MPFPLVSSPRWLESVIQVAIGGGLAGFSRCATRLSRARFGRYSQPDVLPGRGSTVSGYGLMRAMIKAVEWFIGMRYLRAKRRTRFVSFISGISLSGIALGVAALIVILSVMNGLEGDIRERLLSMTAHGRISGQAGALSDWQQVRESMLKESGVVAAAPVVELEGMLGSSREPRGVLVHGVDPGLEASVSGRTIRFLVGGLDDLAVGQRGIVLGRLLALDLNVRVGDGVQLLVPRPGANGGVDPVLERFTVRGVFEAGIQEHDSGLALVHAADAQRLLELRDAVTAVRFLADDVMHAPAVAKSIEGYRLASPSRAVIGRWKTPVIFAPFA